MIDYSLYLVTDDPPRYRGDWLDNVVAAVEGGVTCVQYRDTVSADGERYRRALALKDALKGVPLIVNNDARLAAAVKAEGVHVGQHDMSVAEVRRIVGPGCEIGLSITAPGQLSAIGPVRPDCLGAGPVFDARKTKADAADAMGTGGLAAVLRACAGTPAEGLPVVAIGGITTANVAAVYSTGVDGVAVVSAFSQAADPRAVAATFRGLRPR